MVEKNEKVKTESALAIPAKFKDSDGSLKQNDLLKSYLALEKKMAESKSVPQNPFGTRPDSPDGYQITPKNDLVQSDADVNKRLFDAGFTNEQAQLVYDLAVEKVLPAIQEMADNYAADRQLKALEEEFGGPERFNQIARQILAWGEKNLASEIFNTLSCSKEGILTMYKMMSSNEPPVAQNAAALAEPVNEASLRKIIGTSKYWKQNDPETLKRVESGYKQLYG